MRIGHGLDHGHRASVGHHPGQLGDADDQLAAGLLALLRVSKGGRDGRSARDGNPLSGAWPLAL